MVFFWIFRYFSGTVFGRGSRTPVKKKERLIPENPEPRIYRYYRY